MNSDIVLGFPNSHSEDIQVLEDQLGERLSLDAYFGRQADYHYIFVLFKKVYDLIFDLEKTKIP